MHLSSCCGTMPWRNADKVREKGHHAGSRPVLTSQTPFAGWPQQLLKATWSPFPHPWKGCHNQTHRASKRNVLYLGPISTVGFGLLSWHELDENTTDSLTSPWVPCGQGHLSLFLGIPSLPSSVFGTPPGLINFIKLIIKRWSVNALWTEYKGL